MSQVPDEQPAAQYGTMQAPRNGLGVAALVLGIVGAILALIPLVGIIGMILGALAVIFGLIGYQRSRKGVATNGAMAMIGAVLGAIAIALGIVGLVILGGFVSDVEQELNEIEQTEIDQTP